MPRIVLLLLTTGVVACARTSVVTAPAPAPAPAAAPVTAAPVAPGDEPEAPLDCCTCQLWGVTGPALPLDRDASPPPEACAAILEAEPCATQVCAPPM